MLVKTVIVVYRGVSHTVKVPCNGSESYKELQEAAIKMLRREEERKNKEKSERLLRQLGIAR